MHKSTLALAFISSLLVSIANSAEPNMRPGLWEITTTSDLLWLVQQVPPDQMRNLKDLANEYGFDMPQIQNGAATSNTCITQEMANQNNPPDFYQNQLGCTIKNATHIGKKYKLDFVCASAQLNGNGTAEETFTSPESFAGQTKFDGTVQGNPVNERADITGRWIGAYCGAVKPLQQ